jgi:uncharacterized RDD family membrane protein YckC
MRLSILAVLFVIYSGVAFSQTTKQPAKRQETKSTERTKEEKEATAAIGFTFLGMGLLGMICVGVCGLLFSLLPFMIAVARGHSNKAPIFLVCFFFGWTVVGWVIALIWAFTDNTQGGYRRR